MEGTSGTTGSNDLKKEEGNEGGFEEDLIPKRVSATNQQQWELLKNLQSTGRIVDRGDEL